MAFPASTAVNFIITNPIVGTPPILSTLSSTVSGTPAVPSGIQAINFVGLRVQAWDSTYGACEFIYLKGLASTAAGDVVIYDENANTTTRGVAGSRGPVAVAMSANVANQYGWYMISGSIQVNTAANTVVAGGPCYWTGAAGALDDAVVAGDKIDGMTFKSANATGTALVQLDRPAASGNG